jgi:CheY-like chemotaxis protein
MFQRLSKDWASFLRNLPKMNLPPLVIEHHRSGSIGRNRNDLAEAYLALAESQQDDPPMQRGQTVLVVEDDPEVSQCLCRRLEAEGFYVITAADGEAGYSAAMDRKPDAVVLDVRMPKKDGLAVLRELRSQSSMEHTPIIMLSASIRDQHSALEAGANFFVPKPYEATQVISALETSIRQEALT